MVTVAAPVAPLRRLRHLKNAAALAGCSWPAIAPDGLSVVEMLTEYWLGFVSNAFTKVDDPAWSPAIT